LSESIHHRKDLHRPLGVGVTSSGPALKRGIALTALATAKLTTRLSLAPTARRTKATDAEANCVDEGDSIIVEDDSTGDLDVREAFIRYDLAAVPAGATITGALLTLDPNRAMTESCILREASAHAGDLTNPCALGPAGASQTLAFSGSAAQTFALNAAMVAALQARVGAVFTFYLGNASQPFPFTVFEADAALVVDYWPSGEP
jgi:hypothetical protein